MKEDYKHFSKECEIIEFNDLGKWQACEHFCLTCGKALASVTYEDFDLDKYECPVCKRIMKRMGDVDGNDVCYFISRLMEKIHKEKYGYKYETPDNKLEMLIPEGFIKKKE